MILKSRWKGHPENKGEGKKVNGVVVEGVESGKLKVRSKWESGAVD